MRVLVMATVFPNGKQPALGVFVRERMRRVAEQVDAVVVAPVPWFPFHRVVRGDRWDVPPVERQGALTVYHPRFVCVPGMLRVADGLLYAASLAPFLRRLREAFDFDVIDAHFAYPDGFGAAVLGRAFRRPVVITLRGSIVRLATYPTHRPLLRFALRAAARVIAVSASLKAVAVGLGLPADKIRVIPNGVDTERFRPMDRTAARARLGLPPHRTIVLSVGGLNPGKGQHRVVGLLPELLRTRPDLLYVAVGGEHPGDSSRPLIERLVRERALGAHVLLAGPRPHEEIPVWLAAADVVCLATRSEGWANTLLESLACGRPVVTTRVGGNAEIVTHDGLGILVPPADDATLATGLLAALGRPWDADAMVRHARRHGWDQAARAVVDELGAVVSPRAAAGALRVAGEAR